MSKATNVKSMHALIDELADQAANNPAIGEMMTGLHTILVAMAKTGSDDSDLAIDDDEKPSKKDKDKKSSKKKGKSSKSEESDDDDDDDSDDSDDDDDDSEDADDDEDGDGDDLDALDDLEIDGDEKKSKKGSKKKPAKGKKKDEDEDDDDDSDDSDADDDDDDEDADVPEFEPGKKPGKAFEAFLDALDDAEVDSTKHDKTGVRELTTALQAFGIDPASMFDDEIDKKADKREQRHQRQAMYAQFLAKIEYIISELVAQNEKVLEAVAKSVEVDLDEVSGRGKGRLRKLAHAIIEAVYGGEEEDGDDD